MPDRPLEGLPIEPQLSSATQQVFASAAQEARLLSRPYVDHEHMLLAFTRDSETRDVLLRLSPPNVDILSIRRSILSTIRAVMGDTAADVSSPSELGWTEAFGRIIERAKTEATREESSEIRPIHLLLGMVNGSMYSAGILEIMGIKPENVKREAQRIKVENDTDQVIERLNAVLADNTIEASKRSQLLTGNKSTHSIGCRIKLQHFLFLILSLRE